MHNTELQLYETVKDLMKIADIKHVDKINARFCVVDDRDMMFMVMDDNEVHPTYDFGVWVNTPYFASALSGMFNLAWKDMSSADKVMAKF